MKCERLHSNELQQHAQPIDLQAAYVSVHASMMCERLHSKQCFADCSVHGRFNMPADAAACTAQPAWCQRDWCMQSGGAQTLDCLLVLQLLNSQLPTLILQQPPHPVQSDVVYKHEEACALHVLAYICCS
jgi:hypothetical protein